MLAIQDIKYRSDGVCWVDTRGRHMNDSGPRQIDSLSVVDKCPRERIANVVGAEANIVHHSNHEEHGVGQINKSRAPEKLIEECKDRRIELLNFHCEIGVNANLSAMNRTRFERPLVHPRLLCELLQQLVACKQAVSTPPCLQPCPIALREANKSTPDHSIHRCR